MIARIWHGTTRTEKADEYIDYLNEKGILITARRKEIAEHIFCGKIEGDTAHFYTLTFWDSFDSIKEFADEDYEKARYYPEDEKFLLEFEPTVKHFEVFG